MAPHRSGYIPSLDGWRAIAILAVLMDHDDPWTVFGYSNATYHQFGGWGVFVFFAISGYLVCTRILEDERIQGHFRVGAFYIRRFFRIQPAAFVYIGVISALTLLRVLHESRRSALGALFFVHNYFFDARDVPRVQEWAMFGQFWSLAVEEHFYVVLSALLFFVKRQRVLVFAVLLVLLQVFYLHSEHGSFYYMLAPRATELNIQYLLTPALLAILLQREPVRTAAIKWLQPWMAFSATLVVKALCYFASPPTDHSGLSLTLFPFQVWFYSFEFWVIATALHPRSWTTRFLEWAPLRYLGRWSYSIYLWHALFIIGRIPEAGIHTPWLHVLSMRPWRYLATLVMALASYYFIEKPFIRVGHRLAPPATPGHADLAVSSAVTRLPELAV